jgi:hypothetical protein
MHRLLRFALLAVAASSLLGCRTTVEGLSAHSPTPLSFKRTLVLVDLGAVGTSTVRCDTEAGFARQLQSLGATPSCSLPFDSERTDVSRLLKSATAAGYDGVLSLKLLSASYDAISDSVLWEGRGYVSLHTPGSTTAVFGASVFSLREYRLLWAARVTLHNASFRLRDIRSVQRAYLKQLRADGLLQ